MFLNSCLMLVCPYLYVFADIDLQLYRSFQSFRMRLGSCPWTLILGGGVSAWWRHFQRWGRCRERERGGAIRGVTKQVPCGVEVGRPPLCASASGEREGGRWREAAGVRRVHACVGICVPVCERVGRTLWRGGREGWRRVKDSEEEVLLDCGGYMLQ